jgi:hypothetical protein
MAAPLSFARRTGQLAWLIGPSLVLALLAGCTQTQKSGPAQSPTPEPAKSAPAKPAAKPTAKPAAAAPTPDTAGATAKAEKLAPRPVAASQTPKDSPAKPPARQTVEAVPADATPQLNFSLPQDRPMTDQERDALAAMIRAAAEQGQKRQAAEAPKPKLEVAPTTQPSAPGAAKKEGCGAGGTPTIDLNPPPPDKPQPKLVVKQKKVIADDVWQGKKAEFNFTLTNAGEGPLAIRIKKP